MAARWRVIRCSLASREGGHSAAALQAVAPQAVALQAVAVQAAALQAQSSRRTRRLRYQTLLLWNCSAIGVSP